MLLIPLLPSPPVWPSSLVWKLPHPFRAWHTTPGTVGSLDQTRKKKLFFFSHIKLVITNWKHAWCALPRPCASCNYSRGANVHASSCIDRVANWWQRGWRFCLPASATGMWWIINLIVGCLSWWWRRCWTGRLHQMGLCGRRVGVTTSCDEDLNKQPDARLPGSYCGSQKARTIWGAFVFSPFFFFKLTARNPVRWTTWGFVWTASLLRKGTSGETSNLTVKWRNVPGIEHCRDADCSRKQAGADLCNTRTPVHTRTNINTPTFHKERSSWTVGQLVER